MTAIELANKYYTTGVMSAVEAAAMLRRQHDAIVKLREALANHFYSPSYDASQAVKQALKDTEEIAK